MITYHQRLDFLAMRPIAARLGLTIAQDEDGGITWSPDTPTQEQIDATKAAIEAEKASVKKLNKLDFLALFTRDEMYALQKKAVGTSAAAPYLAELLLKFSANNLFRSDSVSLQAGIQLMFSQGILTAERRDRVLTFEPPL